MNESVNRLGYFLAVLGAFLYAMQVVVGKFILQMGMGARDLLVLQYTGSAILLFVFLIYRSRKVGLKPDRKFLIPIIIQGIFGCCLTSFFFYLAMERVNAGVCSMMLYLCPVYVCIFFMMTGIRSINIYNKLAVAMSFVGALLVLNIFNLHDAKWSVLGIILGLLSGVCYAFYSIHADLKLREMPAEQMLFFMYFIATITFWALNPGFIADPPEMSSAKLVMLVILSILLQVLPMSCLNISIRMIGSNKTSVIASAELPFTVIIAFFVLGESMNILQLAGIVLILAAVVIIQLKKNS